MVKKLLRILRLLFDVGLFGAFFILLLCTFLSVLPDSPTWVGIYAHFKLQYGFAFGILALLFALRRKTSWTRLAVLAACFNLVPVLSSFVPSPSQKASTPQNSYELFAFNVLTLNDQYHKARKFLSEKRPDILVMTEYSPDWHEAICEIWEQYPYRKALPRYGFNGSIIASKYPIKNSETIWFGPIDVPSIMAEIQTPDGSFELIAIHPPSPPNIRDIRYRNAFMDSLSRYVQARHEAGKMLMVAGDYNNTPYHHRFRRFLKETGLRDSRQGFGNQASFPQPLRWFGIPLDHILVSKGIQIEDRWIGPELGSDHLPVICSFSFE